MNDPNLIAEYGVYAAATIGKRSRQAIEQALEANRDIKIVYVDGFYEMHEFKLLSRISSRNINLSKRA